MSSTYRCEHSGGQITLSAGPRNDNGEPSYRMTVFGLADNGGTKVPLDLRALEWLHQEIGKRLQLAQGKKPAYDLVCSCGCRKS